VQIKSKANPSKENSMYQGPEVVKLISAPEVEGNMKKKIHK
jgi:hypothetical protein